VTVEFRRHKNVLDDGIIRYRVVGENKTGLVASSFFSEPGPNGQPSVVESETLVINKRTGSFSRNGISSPPEAPAAQAIGHCIPF
jgi:hypothetical protein